MLDAAASAPAAFSGDTASSVDATVSEVLAPPAPPAPPAPDTPAVVVPELVPLLEF